MAVEPTTGVTQIAESRKRMDAELDRLAVLIANDAKAEGRASGFQQGLAKGREGHANVVKFPVLPGDVQAALDGLDPIVRLLADAGDEAPYKELCAGAIKARGVLANVLKACQAQQETPATPAAKPNVFRDLVGKANTGGTPAPTERVEPVTNGHATDAQTEAYRDEVTLFIEGTPDKPHFRVKQRRNWLHALADALRTGMDTPEWEDYREDTAPWNDDDRKRAAAGVKAAVDKALSRIPA